WNSRAVNFHGERISLADLAKVVGKPYSTVYSAHRRGETPEQIAAEKRPARRFPDTTWRHPVPELEPIAEREFDRWKRKLNRSHRNYGCIDVFFLLAAANEYAPLKSRFMQRAEFM